MKSSILTKTEQETIAFAEVFLKKALEGAEKEKPLIFCLIGELGAGKTQFVKGIGKGLGVRGITSPTFVLMKKFIVGEIIPGTRNGLPVPPSAPSSFGGAQRSPWTKEGLPRVPRQTKVALRDARGKKFFFHIDCYRVYDSGDAKQIGIDKIIQSPRAIVAIEWAERILDIVPRPYWEVRFECVGEEKRRITYRFKI